MNSSSLAGFVCFEKRAIIEIDGGQHDSNSLRDRKRDKWLESQGCRVLRFWNNEIMENLEGVLEIIRSHV
jgi:very-short-patch-repair endonuclease